MAIGMSHHAGGEIIRTGKREKFVKLHNDGGINSNRVSYNQYACM